LLAHSNEAYDEAIAELSHKAPEVHQSRSAATKQDDYYRGFRTRLVMFWIGSNGILVAVICSSVMEKKLTLTVSYLSRFNSWKLVVYFGPHVTFSRIPDS
jgi:chitin synthase